MKIGLIGLSKSGKTTVFNALTKSKADTNSFSALKNEPNLAVVDVGDKRIDQLTQIYQPKKVVYATIELTDFMGFNKGSGKDGLFPPELMKLARNVDALAVVIRNFEDDYSGSPTPQEDIEQIEVELLLSDLIVVEKRLERIAEAYKKGLKSNLLQIEERALGKILEQLNNNKFINGLTFEQDELKTIRTHQLLTQKPIMVILNSSESNFGKNDSLLNQLKQKYNAIEFSGKFEMELAQLENEEEIQMFMDDIGIVESARHRLTGAAYELLGYISFFTVGADEVRAWNIYKGDTAVDAAAAIHTDLAKGFIRAECFHYDALIECGSEKAVRGNGHFRLEGKDYKVRDGDILSIRFNI
ncbi:redox-regulated ATPase YchF [candidate division KSB1 bacterium]|nr:redox-regulated ATPase YchF [candidate division KSB1 bacterium]